MTSPTFAENIDLVHRIASKIDRRLPPNSFTDIGDLIQDGSIGLMQAIERFDPSNGAQFTTFADRRIRGNMIDGMRSRDYLNRSFKRRKTPVFKTVSLTPTPTNTFSDELCDCRPCPAAQLVESHRIPEMTQGLSREDGAIVSLYFGEDLSMRTIAAAIGVCESRVSQRMAICLKVLRAQLTPDGERRDVAPGATNPTT